MAGKARSSRNADKPESFNRQIQAINQEVAVLVSQATEVRDSIAIWRIDADVKLTQPAYFD